MAPYERPPLSKEYLRGESGHHFVRPPEWYAEHAIDARFGSRAERVDVTGRVVELEGGERVPFDQVVIPASHNSMSVADGTWYLAEQPKDMVASLDDGIRGLLVDTWYGQPAANGRASSSTSFAPRAAVE